VKAAGVAPAICVENTQLADSEIASIAENATISKSAVQSFYKLCLKFPELQPSDFPLGAIESVGGGSLALKAAEGDVGDRSSTVQADASRMVKGVAKQVKQFMVTQKWNPADSGASDSSQPVLAAFLSWHRVPLNFHHLSLSDMRSTGVDPMNEIFPKNFASA
jgi:hypothetical protein